LNKNKKLKTSSSGFTLLELIIALSLMAVISITSTQMLRNSTTQTKKLTQGLDYTNRLRSAFNVIRNDVAQAVNFRDLNLFLYNQAQEERFKNYEKKVKDAIDEYNKEKSPTPLVTLETMTPELRSEILGPKGLEEKPPEPKPKKEKVITHFVGEKDKVYFTSASGLRFRAADKVSNLIEVGYFFRTCKSRTNPKNESKCLWRSISYNLDEDVTKGGKESVLLEHIEEFEFKYLSFVRNRDTADWIKSWDSREANIKTQDNFPAAVSLYVTTKVPLDKAGKKFKNEKFKGVFNLYFTNNKPFEKLKATPQTGTAPQDPQI
jgi:prepilin-type N-terminal cleavage/methylation domain-containing protein